MNKALTGNMAKSHATVMCIVPPPPACALCSSSRFLEHMMISRAFAQNSRATGSFALRSTAMNWLWVIRLSSLTRFALVWSLCYSIFVLSWSLFSSMSRCRINNVCPKITNHTIKKLFNVEDRFPQFQRIIAKSQTLHICRQFSMATSHSIEQKPYIRQMMAFFLPHCHCWSSACK